MPLSRKTWLRVSLLFLPLILVVLLFKILKLARMTGEIQPLLLLEIWREDLLFLFTLVFSALVGLEATLRVHPLWRHQVLWGLHLLALIFLGLSAAEFSFFLRTGSNGDWFLLKYGLARFQEIRQVMASVVHGVVWLLLLLPVFLNVLPVFLEKLPPIRRWLEADPRLADLQSKQASTFWKPFSPRLAWALFFLWSLLLLPPPLPLTGAAQTLQTSLIPSLVRDALQEAMWDPKGAADPSKKPSLFDTERARLLATPKTKKMNLVLIFLESVRSRSLTPYNPSLPTTPFLNELSKDAALVEHMYAVLPHTSKALVATLCGIYPKVTMDIVEGQLRGIPGMCLPRLLQPFGYQSAFFQSATIAFEGRAQMVENMGFDLLKGDEDFQQKNFASTNYFGREDRIMFKPSLDWLDTALARKQPFFLTYLTLVSHHTYTTPPWFKQTRYTDSKDPEFNHYLNSLRYTDDYIRDLFAEFKKRGLMETTLFVLIGDHGEAFDEHQRRQHDNVMWDEGLHIPAIFYAPKTIAPQRVRGRHNQLDLLPTIFDLLGYHVADANFPGQSVFQPHPPDRPLFATCWYEKQCMALRKGPLKYIYHYRRRGMEIYETDKDPDEKKSLLHVQPFDGVHIAAIEQSLLGWRDQTNYLYEAANQRRLSQAISSTKPPISHPLDIRFGPYVRLLGYHLKTPFLRPGETLDITYVFQALQPIPSDWRFFFHLDTERPYRFLNADHIPVGGTHPPHQWKVGQYIQDHHRVRIPGDFPQKTNLLVYLGMWSNKKGRLPILGPPTQVRTDGNHRFLLRKIPLLAP